MTVSELRDAIKEYDGDDLVPLDVVIPDLTYIVAALEQWREAADVFGRSADYEVAAFLSRPESCL